VARQRKLSPGQVRDGGYRVMSRRSCSLLTTRKSWEQRARTNQPMQTQKPERARSIVSTASHRPSFIVSSSKPSYPSFRCQQCASLPPLRHPLTHLLPYVRLRYGWVGSIFHRSESKKKETAIA